MVLLLGDLLLLRGQGTSRHHPKGRLSSCLCPEGKGSKDKANLSSLICGIIKLQPLVCPEPLIVKADSFTQQLTFPNKSVQKHTKKESKE